MGLIGKIKCYFFTKHTYVTEHSVLGTKYIQYRKCPYCKKISLKVDEQLPVEFILNILRSVLKIGVQQKWTYEKLVPYDIPKKINHRKVLIEKYEDIYNPSTGKINVKKVDELMFLPKWKEILTTERTNVKFEL